MNRDDEANASIDRLWAEHPDYLFKKILVGQRLLDARKLKNFERFFDGRFDLKLLYPDRSVFHFTEAISFWTLLVEFCLLIGDPVKAAFYLDEMESLRPGHPNLERLNRLFDEMMGRVKQLAAEGPAVIETVRDFRHGSHSPKKDRNRKSRRRR